MCFKPRIENFFHSPQLCAPQIAHVVEALVNGVEAFVHGVESSLEKSDNKPDQRGVKQHRNADQDIELFVGHQMKCAPPGTIFPQGVSRLTNRALRCASTAHRELLPLAAAPRATDRACR